MPSLQINKPDFPPQYDIVENEPLSRHTSIRVGGPAQFFCTVKDPLLFVELYRFCRATNIPFLALGGGTNVFFSEAGRAGMVAAIRFDRMVTVGKAALVVEAGASLEQISALCLECGLSGFEFASGIPGTLGGAVYGNAGAYGRSIGELIVRARILTPEGRIETVDRDFFRFAYRWSYLKEYPAIVLQAELQLSKGDPERIRAACEEILALRRQKLPPPETPTAGSWFKNIETGGERRQAAAVYLDAVGAKQTRVGDAAVHPKHANVFYNAGRATAAQLLELEEILRRRVLERFGIRLEREVIYYE